MRRSLVIATLWLLSVILVGTLVYAQGRGGGDNVISGNDLRFVVERQQGGVALGYFEVRISGQWMPVGPGSGGGHLVPIK